MAARWDERGKRGAALWDPRVLADIGDPELTAEIVELFTRQMSDALPELSAALERGSGEHVHALAHRLKGSALTVGAPRLAALLEELSTAGASAQLADAMELLPRLTDTWQATAAELAKSRRQR
ncbi:MAG TPA: Hpt domain-containing protein [Solirubrobacteraceae bacterium]|nr:Hpt domain-containing protein [Solirubrobacteraceae bacterium]